MKTEKLDANHMAAILSSKLTREEYHEFFLLIDGDGPAGVFWEAIMDKAVEMFPEEFVFPKQKIEEIQNEEV